MLTNDGDLTHHLTHPRYGVTKTYRATADGFVKPEDLQELEQGVWLADPKTGKGVKTGRSRIRIVKRTGERTILEIQIREGRNRQVRRMLARLGHKVRDLMRIRMGPLTLDGLAPGQSRMLAPREVKALKQLGKGESEGETKPETAARPARPTPRPHPAGRKKIAGVAGCAKKFSPKR